MIMPRICDRAKMKVWEILQNKIFHTDTLSYFLDGLLNPFSWGEHSLKFIHLYHLPFTNCIRKLVCKWIIAQSCLSFSQSEANLLNKQSCTKLLVAINYTTPTSAKYWLGFFYFTSFNLFELRKINEMLNVWNKILMLVATAQDIPQLCADGEGRRNWWGWAWSLNGALFVPSCPPPRGPRVENMRVPCAKNMCEDNN